MKKQTNNGRTNQAKNKLTAWQQQGKLETPLGSGSQKLNLDLDILQFSESTPLLLRVAGPWHGYYQSSLTVMDGSFNN